MSVFAIQGLTERPFDVWCNCKISMPKTAPAKNQLQRINYLGM